ncbi:hypothetical protein C8A01DRAFT_39143 [Parachaetomium inaequale]|uniref:DUF1857-domain-containing protein n=1 Tax=Parachaetomium inaequale TaxID=2588326 RepID=A0AAN6P9Q9_9PEZI|nr:hypothetical protein C8A01DRAFT_39143 [Parachaetomium inaequale]
MPTLNFAYTAPINPPGATPVLTPSQVWTGLQYKVRRAEKFVPVITACEVLSETKPTDSEDEHVITRLATFQAGAGPKGGDTVKEVCKLYAPCRIDFLQEDGTTIGNYVSRGPGGELMMTYVFQWKVKGELGEGVEERYANMARIAVEGSIETIRKIVTGEVVMD